MPCDLQIAREASKQAKTRIWRFLIEKTIEKFAIGLDKIAALRLSQTAAWRFTSSRVTFDAPGNPSVTGRKRPSDIKANFVVLNFASKVSTPPNVGAGIRRSRRVKVNFAIKLFAVVQQRRCVLQGRSHDLSDEGMAIYIPAELELGQKVQIEFILPNSAQRLGVSAIVRDCEGFRCGVQFDSLTATDRKALEQCCAQLAN